MYAASVVICTVKKVSFKTPSVFFLFFAVAAWWLCYQLNVDSIVLGQAAGVEHVSFYSRTELPASIYSTP